MSHCTLPPPRIYSSVLSYVCHPASLSAISAILVPASPPPPPPKPTTAKGHHHIQPTIDMLTSTPGNPAIQAYKVYHLSQVKLDRECRRQTPDLHRIVLHASIVDNVRRWSNDVTTPSETVIVDSDSENDSDPFDESASSEDDDCEDAVAIFDIEVDDDSKILEHTQATGKVSCHVQHVEKKDSKKDSKKSTSKSKSQSKSKSKSKISTDYELKSQSWKRNRPVTVQETVVEVDGDN